MQRDKITGVVQALTLTWYLYVSSFKIKYWILLRDVPATKNVLALYPCIGLLHRIVSQICLHTNKSRAEKTQN